MSERRPIEVTHTFPKVNVINRHLRSKFREALSSASETPQTTPDVSPPPQSSWFNRLNISQNQGTGCAQSHVIDVQPDLRYPLAYITYSARELYATAIRNDPQSRVSPFTFLYYCQSLVVATLLFYDLHSRPIPSSHATFFLQEVDRSRFSDLLFELRVPNFMAQILSHLCPAYDAHQPRLLYVPTLAGFSPQHDFGRLVPPGIFLAAASSIIWRTEDDADPMESLRSFYSTKLLTIAGKDYFTTNFLGGPYMDGDEVCDHSNWIRQDVENFVRSGMHSYEHVLPFVPLNFAHEKEINPYDVMFCYSSENYMTLLSVFSSVSRFFQEEEPSSLTLRNVLSSPSSITIMSHFYASPTLPTCHSLPPPPTDYKNEHVFVDDAQFAGKVNFLSNPSVESQGRVQFSPLGFERFDLFANVRGDIFGFQPYGQDFDSLAAAVTLGLTIENGDIDGVTISQPNVRLPLCDNSNLLQGSLPVRVVRGYIPNFLPENRLVIFKRAGHRRYPNIPVGFARGDMGQIISRNDQSGLPVDVNEACYTYMAWNRADEVLPIPDSSIYFWSSYRFVHNAHDGETQEVYFYFTLRPLYGNVVKMTQLSCPSWLFP